MSNKHFPPRPPTIAIEGEDVTFVSDNSFPVGKIVKKDNKYFFKTYNFYGRIIYLPVESLADITMAVVEKQSLLKYA